jgi:hypothetical protein
MPNLPAPVKTYLRKVEDFFPIRDFRALLRKKEPPVWPIQTAGTPSLSAYEYSLYSQNGEDGIIRYLFSEIGFQSRKFLEFGFGVTENNSLRLIMKEHFGGVYLDGNLTTVRRFNRLAQWLGHPEAQAHRGFLDLDNLKSIIQSTGLPHDIDFLSIDVDGNDYWFWKQIDFLNPRVVVIEYNASFGPDLKVSVPYDPSFDRHQKHPSGFYHGASFEALKDLGQQKGYRLVGCNSGGLNAFFVRENGLTPSLRHIAASASYVPNRWRAERGFSQKQQLDLASTLPLEGV